MNREETMEAIKVMQAFVDKKRVRTAFGQELHPQGHCFPDWNWTKGLEVYVIVPEPIERWIAVWDDDVLGGPQWCYQSKDECEKTCADPKFIKAIKLVEET